MIKRRFYFLLLGFLIPLSTITTASASTVGPMISGDKFYYESSPFFYEGRKILLDEKKGEKAMITFKKAVEEGDGRAAMWIGIMYAQAECGIPEHPQNAMKWYQKSLELGFPGANAFIALLYLNGQGVPMDKQKAFHYMSKLEDVEYNDFVDDMLLNITSRFYHEGIGTRKDFKTARKIASRIVRDGLRNDVLQEIARAEEESKPKPPTMGERNALMKAQMYLEMAGFSKKGLREQLTFEGFTRQETDYAVKYCEADWDEQAARKATMYLEMTAFSRRGLIEQLQFEGFTREQAEYGVSKVGY